MWICNDTGQCHCYWQLSLVTNHSNKFDESLESVGKNGLGKRFKLRALL